MISRSKIGRDKAEAGFTLIEMIVVLVILGLALGLVVARGPMRSRGMQAAAAASDVAQALRLARTRAIAGDRQVEFTVDLAQHSFRVDGGPPHLLPPSLGVSAIAASGQTLGQRFAGIRFDPDGGSSGGRIELVEGRRRLQVGVDWFTGRVRIADAH
ncbi:MAG: GspH/FimT family pseudopilin [Acidisphaera sp.]|nr:GspH/FimT family pseudopilin [Acidisphaera sp.]